MSLEKRQQEAALIRADSMQVYLVIRKVVSPLFKILCRPDVTGEENFPPEGAYILTSNHRSFFDSFFQAIICPRPIHWMAKAELFKYPFLDRLLVKVGAFPVRRGRSDQGALACARALLEGGEIVAIFPEGTRVRSGVGDARSGAARLAVETQVPLVPMAIVGSERGSLRRALWHRGERVRISIGPAVYEETEVGRLNQKVWPEVVEQVNKLEGHRALAIGVSALAASLAAIWLKKRR